MKTFLLLAVCTLFLMGCSKPIAYEIVIQNVGLFDGYEDKGAINIAINGDSIAAITSDDLISDSLIDGAGKYIVPGLVNAHVHASTIEQLQEGYPFGILTLLNMHTGLEERELGWKKISQDSTGFSILYGSGHAATVPEGHPTQFSPDMETINDSLSIQNWVDHRIEKNVDYIKIIRDHHEWLGYPPLPTLSFEHIHQIIDYAHRKGFKVVVHANTIQEMVKIAKFKPDGFVHMLDYKEDFPVSERYYQELKESGVFIVPTGGFSLKPMDGAPPLLAKWVKTNLLNPQQRAEIIKKYAENGIMLVAGTDAQDGQMNFGEDYFLELDLYKMAGLSNVEILKVATGNAAKAFDLPIGELKVGSNANFVMLDDNPIHDLSNLKKVAQVWKNGKTK